MAAVVFFSLFNKMALAATMPSSSKADEPGYSKLIEPEKLKEDLDFLFKTIEEFHPNIYAYTSKEEFETLRDELYKSINQPMSAYEFYKLTAPVVASLKNFHILLLPFFEEYKQYAKNGGSDQAQERIKNLRANLPGKFENKTNGDIVTIELPFRRPAYNPHRFDGRVFLLIGRQSFSASTVFSSLVKCYKIATLIGEETGDPTTLYADSIMFILPNSRVEAGVASKLLVCACGKPDGRGVIPDYEVKQKPEDTAKGVDMVLQFTLNLIKNREAKK